MAPVFSQTYKIPEILSMVTGIKSPVPIFNVFFGQKFIAICNETIQSLTNQLKDFSNKNILKGQTFFAHKNEIDGEN
jgi:hypothetical protein